MIDKDPDVWRVAGESRGAQVRRNTFDRYDTYGGESDGERVERNTFQPDRYKALSVLLKVSFLGLVIIAMASFAGQCAIDAHGQETIRRNTFQPDRYDVYVAGESRGAQVRRNTFQRDRYDTYVGESDGERVERNTFDRDRLDVESEGK